MTTIIGLKTEEGALLGCDSCGTSGWQSETLVQKKIIEVNDELAIGHSGAIRTLNILHDNKGKFINSADRALRIDGICGALHEICKEHDLFETDSNGDKEANSFFIVALRGNVYRVDDHFGYYQSSSGIVSTGSGHSFALGAMNALTGKPKEKITRALEICEDLDAATRGPFYIISQDRK